MIRNYVYVSKSKLADYFQQISHDNVLRKDGQKIAAELGFDIKAIKGNLKFEQTPFQNCFGMLQLVEKYIAKHHRLGDLDSGGE